MQRLNCLLLVFVTWSCFAGEPAGEKPKALNEAVQIGEFPAVINESSGLIKSKLHAARGIFWTHNDSGDTARIFAVDEKGKLLREVNIPGAKNRDWEELTMDSKGRLIVGDIGDNHHKHDSFTLYRFNESTLTAAPNEKIQVEAFHFKYPKGEGPFDAEALVPHGDNVILFTKDGAGTRWYKLPLPEKVPPDATPQDAVFIGATNKISILTGAALSDDGRHLALLNYLVVSVYELPKPLAKMDDNEMKTLLDCPRRVRVGYLGQTEAIAFDGNDLLLTCEQGKIFRIKEAIPFK